MDEFREKMEIGGGGGIRPVIKEGKFCGYSEALSWYQIYKESITSKIYMECRDN